MVHGSVMSKSTDGLLMGFKQLCAAPARTDQQRERQSYIVRDLRDRKPFRDVRLGNESGIKVYAFLVRLGRTCSGSNCWSELLCGAGCSGHPLLRGS